jgi:hypothetical protein
MSEAAAGQEPEDLIARLEEEPDGEQAEEAGDEAASEEVEAAYESGESAEDGDGAEQGE